MEKLVKAYIEKQGSPQKEILRKVREIFQKTVPNSKEKMRWGAIVFGNDTFYLAVIKNRVHVGFAITGLSPKEIKLFEGTGKTMRHIKIHTLDDIDDKKLVELITLVENKATCKKP